MPAIFVIQTGFFFLSFFSFSSATQQAMHMQIKNSFTGGVATIFPLNEEIYTLFLL